MDFGGYDNRRRGAGGKLLPYLSGACLPACAGEPLVVPATLKRHTSNRKTLDIIKLDEQRVTINLRILNAVACTNTDTHSSMKFGITVPC